MGRTRRVLSCLRHPMWVCLCVAVLTGLTAPAAVAQPSVTFTVLAEVKEPWGGVILGSDGALYGTSRTGVGVSASCGFVYRLTPQADGTFQQTILHSFPQDGAEGCSPQGELVEGPDGALYGTTMFGGPNIGPGGSLKTGTIFKVTKTGDYQLLHAFAGQSSSGYWEEGVFPAAGLTLGLDGNLYGVTSSRGVNSTGGNGTIFRVTPSGTFGVIYHLGAGLQVQDALTRGSDGNFYGTSPFTAFYTGDINAGVFFRITPAGGFSRVFAFPHSGVSNANCCALGSEPQASPIEVGGSYYVLGRAFGPAGFGTIVRVDGTGAGTLVQAFDGVTGGGSPQEALTLGADGYLYGVTSSANQSGPSIFRVSAAGTLETLHQFVASGSGPQARLLEIAPGQFIGTTASGLVTGGYVFRLTVVPENRAPVASNGSATTAEDTGTSGQLSATDADNDPLTYAIVSNGTLGTATVTNAATGAFTYTPNPDAYGSDSFTFKANDGTADSAVATVTVTIDPVNDAAVALDSEYPAVEDTPLSASFQATDVDSATLTFSIVTNGSKGTAVLTDAATGAFTYTPNSNANGSDAVAFQVSDGALSSNVGTFTINIAAVNDAPVAQTGVVTTSEGVAVNGTLQATDQDGGALTYSLSSPPAQGLVTITDASTGAFTYTPNTGNTGYDTFTFSVSDGHRSSTGLQMIFIVASTPHWPGQTVRASVPGDGTQADRESFKPVLSADGRYVAFSSWATNLVAGDSNASSDVFVQDRQTGEVWRVSVGSNGAEGNSFSSEPALSGDGRYVAFRSDASSLVAGDTNSTLDVFVHDRQTGETRRVSVASDGTQGNGVSYQPSLSGDGRYVAFHSDASNLVAADTNGTADVFVHDWQTGETQRVSVASDGTPGNDYSYEPSMSADGRYIVFSSFASNLVAGDTNNRADVFVHDRMTGETQRVSVASDGTQSGGDSYVRSVSADGRYVAFISLASNLAAGDTNFVPDVFVHDRETGQTSRVSVASDGSQENADSYQAALTADGRYVAFVSVASNLVPGDTNGTRDVFVHDRQTGETRRVSVASDGTQGNNHSIDPSLSADARYAAFTSYASNLVAGDTNGYVDVFVVGAAPLPSVPVATDDAITTLEDTPASGVLDATDPNGAALTFAIVSSGTLGTATLTNAVTGAYTYTPNPDASGTDSFTFQASNGSASSNVATVTITITPVNDAPVAGDGALATSEDTASTGTLSATDVDGPALSFSLVADGTLGTASITNPATGAYTYTPNPNAFGTDTFTFRATDGTSLSNVATITVTIGAINDPPVASDGTLTTTEDSAAGGTLTAVDPDGDALSYVVVTNGAKGRATITNPSTGAFSYKPFRNATGTDTFTFVAGDGSLQSTLAVITVTITPVNDRPVAHGQSLFVLEDASKSISLAATDVDGDNLVFSLETPPTYGTLSGVLPNVTYAPALNYNGPDSFTFRVFDGTAYSTVATTVLNIVPTLWETFGPEGGRITALVIDPGNPAVIYAGTTGGLFKSTDGGDRWLRHSSGLTDLRVTALAIDSTSSNVLYAGTNDGGFKSIDGGVTWQRKMPFAPSALAIDPVTPMNVYAGSGSVVWKSSDGGLTWADRSSGLTREGYVRAIAIDPQIPDTLYVATDTGVFKSTNAAAAWDPIHTGLTTTVSRSASAVAIDVSRPSTLFLSTGGGVFKSTNGGLNWSSANAGLPSGGLPSIAISPSSPDVIYAAAGYFGMFRSSDGGTTWVATGAEVPDPVVVAVNSASANTVYAGTAWAGVFRTDSGGWRSANGGLTATNTSSLAVDPTPGSPMLFAGTTGLGVQRSLDLGLTWSASSGTIQNASIITLAVIPLTPSTVFAAPKQGLLKSTDWGTTWTSLGLEYSQIYSIAMTADGQTIYVGILGAEMQKSTNGGASWSKVSSGPLGVYALAIDPLTPSSVYAGTDSGVFKSTDGGNTWTKTGNGILSGAVRSLAIDPTSPLTLYAGTVGGGVFKSIDGGANWTLVRSFDAVLAISVDPSSPTTVYAAVGNGEVGVFRSLDGGVTWKQHNAGLGSPRVNALAVGNDGTAYAGTEGGVSLLRRAQNDPPIAGDRTITTAEGTAVSIVLGATDPDGDATTFTVVVPPSNGTLSGTEPNLTYTPLANYSGADSFTFTANDGAADSNVATVSITVTPVNVAPTASNVSLGVTEDVAASGTLQASDGDGDALTYSLVSNGAKGTAVLTNAETGAFTYTPNRDANGADAFTFKVSDGTFDSNVATVSVTITPVDDAPIASDGALTTAEDTLGSGSLSASDIDSPTLSYSIVINGTKGTAAVTDTIAGTFSYTPNANATGNDTFTFRVNDGSLDSNLATVTVTISPVNDAPTASNGALTTNEDTAASGTMIASDVDADSLTFSIASNGTKGTAVLTSATTGSYTYTPDANANGTDTFTFKVDDGSADSNVATVTVTIAPVNDAPVAQNGTLSVATAASATGTLVASDIDGPALTYSIAANGAKGSAVITDPSTGAYTYTAGSATSGTDSFTFTASDGSLVSNVGTVTVTITASTQPPTASDGTITTQEDRSVSGTLVAIDPEHARLVFSIVSNGSKGTATITNSSNGRFTYVPSPNANGVDSFTFRANDGVLDSNVATVTVTITPVNDAPVASDGSVTTARNTAVSGTLQAVDVDGDVLTFSIARGARRGTVTLTNSQTGAFTYVPNPNFAGSDSFTFTVTDGAQTASGTIRVTVTP